MKRQGVTAVAILSTDTFDAPAEIMVDTVRFGPTGTEAAAVRCATEDANADCLGDLVCHFRVQDTCCRDGDTVGIVTAQLTSGATLFSTDAVRILHGGSDSFLATR